MVRASLICNGVSITIHGNDKLFAMEQTFGIGDYVIIVTENNEGSKFNTVAKVVDYTEKSMIFDNSTAFESRLFKIFYSNMLDIYKITKERARMLLRFGGTQKMY